jgi:hypothetical protein
MGIFKTRSVLSWPQDIEELKTRIRQEVLTVTKDILREQMESFSN